MWAMRRESHLIEEYQITNIPSGGARKLTKSVNKDYLHPGFIKHKRGDRGRRHPTARRTVLKEQASSLNLQAALN